MKFSSGSRFDRLRHALYPKDLLGYLIVLFFISLMILFLSVTHLELFPNGHLAITSPHVVTGDEPHYLLVVNGILFDHELELQNAYQRAENAPDIEAGNIQLPDHHTILVNRRTRAHGIWLEEHWDLDLAPGPDVYEVSAHPLAYPLLLAALIAPFRPEIENVQSYASVVMVLICWLGAVLTFRLARQVGLSRGTALLTAGLLVFASPWLAYSRSLFAEPVIGVFAAAALLELESDRPLLAALFAATAFLFKPAMVMIGAGFVIEQMLEHRWTSALAMALVLGVIGAGLIAFNFWLAATPIIAGTWSGPWPFGDNTATDLSQLTGTLFGSRYGLLIWCPWTIFALVPIILALVRPGLIPRVITHMRIPVSLQLALLGSWSVGPGACYGPRHWIPFLPWMAVAAVIAVRSSRNAWRIAFYALVAVTIVISIVGALRYPQFYSRPPWRLLAFR